jgi:hypothetical protein
MALLTPFELIKKGATGLINQGKGFFNAPDNSTAGIIKNTVLGLPKAAKETFVPTRGYTEQQLKEAKPTLKESVVAAPKVASEIYTGIGRLGEMGAQYLPGYNSLMNKLVQTKTGNVLSNVIPKLEQFQTPKTVGEAKAMRFLDIAGLAPVGSIKNIGTVSKVISKLDDVNRITNELQAIGIPNNVVKTVAPKLIKETNPEVISKIISDSYAPKIKTVEPLEQEAKTKSQLEQIWKEAKKYKSAEEFVKAQGTLVYRGGTDLSKEKIKGAGISVSKGKNVAEDFVKQNGGKIEEIVIDQNAKIADYSNVPNVKFKNLNDYSPELDTGNKQIWKDLEIEYQKAVNWAKENGYDGIKLPLEGETRIINKDVIKTKSQLEQIWKEANKGTEPVVPKPTSQTPISPLKTVVKETQPRERGFITSAKEAVPEAATRIGGQYIPRSTDELAIKARNEITDNIDRADAYVRNNSDDKATAIAAELIKKYADDALKATDETTKNIFLDKAASIANDYAHKLTESGRSIQAASILSRLTPEGQVRFAAREIQKYNDLNPTKKIPELTGQQAENIINKMENINKLDDGMEKTKAFKELQDEILDLVPTPVMKKIVNVWKAGLLTGIKTTGLNIFSNLTHQATEIAKDVPAAIVDSVVSLFTKKRTKTFTLKGEGGGVSQGFNKGWDYFKSGVDERNIGQKLDYSRVSFGKGPVAKAFQKYTEVVFRSLGAGDQPFYYGALSRSLMDQALAMGKNKGLKGNKLKEFVYKQVENPTEDMIRYATADAATAVFQNETYLGNAAKKIQEIPIVGEILVPFARTPSSVAMQVVRYTPVGTAGTIIEQIAKGKFDQRLFSEAVGRGLTGTAVLAIGTYLYNKGMMALDRPKTEREKEQWKLEGRKENSILINGKWRSPTVLGPAGILLLVGGHFKDALDTAGSPTEAMAKTLLGSVKSFTEQTFLTGISSALNALMDPQRYAESYIGSLVSSVIPTIVSDVARATDKKERRPEGVGDRFKQRIPGVRQTVEPQVDVLGKEVERIGNPLEVMLDPTRPSPVKSSPVIAELRRLTDKGYDVSPTLLGDKKGFAALSKEQNTELWKTAGTIIDSKLNSLFAKEEYQSLSAEKKSKVVTKIIDQAKVNARAAMAVELTVGLSGEALKSKLSELKKGGLLTEEVFNKYKEIR